MVSTGVIEETAEGLFSYVTEEEQCRTEMPGYSVMVGGECDVRGCVHFSCRWHIS